MAHLVSVIMPVLNEEGHLEDAVTAVLEQEFVGEILLALGPSRDKTNEIAKRISNKHDRIHLIQNPLGLTTVGMNLAIKQAKYEYIVRVDAHSEPGENYIAKSVELLDELDADLVGGIMVAKGKTLFQRSVAWAYNSPFGLGSASYHVGGKAREAESAYLGVFKKSALARVGGFDESIIRGEDWELAQRIKSTGGLVWFSPTLKVTYWPRSSWTGLVKQFYSTGVWRGDLTRRDVYGAPMRYYAPPALVLSALFGLLLAPLGLTFGWLPILAYVTSIFMIGSFSARLAPVPLVLATMHISWGVGFLMGFFLGAKGTIDRSRLTR